jgi:hypothetical protein
MSVQYFRRTYRLQIGILYVWKYSENRKYSRISRQSSAMDTHTDNGQSCCWGLLGPARLGAGVIFKCILNIHILYSGWILAGQRIPESNFEKKTDLLIVLSEVYRLKVYVQPCSSSREFHRNCCDHQFINLWPLSKYRFVSLHSEASEHRGVVGVAVAAYVSL